MGISWEVRGIFAGFPWDVLPGSRVREAKKKSALRLQRPPKLSSTTVRRRHPGEELYCPFMLVLDEAIKS